MNQKILSEIIRNDNLVEKTKNVVSGTVKGYQTTISFLVQGKYTISMNVVQGEREPLQPIIVFLERLKSQNKKIISAVYFDSHIEITGLLPNSKKKYGETIAWCLDCVTYYLQENGFVTGCAICGNRDVHTKLCNINEHMIMACDSCYEEKVSLVEQNKITQKEKKSNVVTGLVGGLFGSLIGVLAWVIIFKLGYIAAISGIIMVVCVMKGYELMGGKMNALGAVLCFVISIGMIYVAHRLAWSIVIAEELTSYGVSYYFRNLNGILDLLDGWAEFMKGLVYGIIFMVIGGVSILHSAYKERMGKVTMKQFD